MTKRRWITATAMMWLGVAGGCTPTETDTTEPELPLTDNLSAGRLELSTPESRESPTRHLAGELTVEVVPRFASVLAGKSGPLDVLVRIQAPEAVAAERPELDLALVLDRSGSMSGEKIAAVKQAALETVRKLNPNDRLTFISYSDHVNVHSRRTRVGDGRDLQSEILGISPGGGTALGPALDEGLRVLADGRRGEDVVAHVMLLSDGLANTGESSPEVLAAWTASAFAEGVATSTLGVGLDYNEDLMTRLADAGGGRYHFIETGAQVPEVLGDEFAGLTATAARQMMLSVEAGSGIELAPIPGYPNVVDGDVVSAKIGSMASGRTRELLVRMELPVARGESMALGRYVVRFRDVLDDGKPVELVVEPSVRVTSDPKDVEASENYAVTVRASEIDVAAALKSASSRVADGDYGKAREALERHTESLRQEAAKNPHVDFAPMIEDLEEAEKDLEHAQRSLGERKRYQKKHKAKAYKSSKAYKPSKRAKKKSTSMK